jgi:hypothetical protein
VVAHGEDGDRYARRDRRAGQARRRRCLAHFTDGLLARRQSRAPDDGAGFARALVGRGVRVRSAAARHRRPRRRGDPPLFAPARTDAAARVLRRQRNAAAVRFRRGAGAGLIPSSTPDRADARPLRPHRRRPRRGGGRARRHA